MAQKKKKNLLCIKPNVLHWGLTRAKLSFKVLEGLHTLYYSVKPGAAWFTFIPLASLASGIILLECVIQSSSNQFLVLLSSFNGVPSNLKKEK